MTTRRPGNTPRQNALAPDLALATPRQLLQAIADLRDGRDRAVVAAGEALLAAITGAGPYLNARKGFRLIRLAILADRHIAAIRDECRRRYFHPTHAAPVRAI